ncbi:alpha/beta fold hydrolase [Nocardia sp. NPDC052001]|uniref:alpha/beta fold hydrolase n=1 Tax=Nocardia sp. NPDC052001 TaxID=3154853 RepID=UPI00343BEAF5
MRRFEMVDLGYELAVSLRPGNSDVPVIHINALGTGRDQWDQVLLQPHRHPTLTYDRPGIGDSGSLPRHLAEQPRTLGSLADELHQLVNGLGIDSPHVVVGHSIGGLIAMLYAARYCADTAGIVLVDATTLDHLIDADWPEHEGDERDQPSPGSSKLDPAASLVELRTAVVPPMPAVVLASAQGRWLRLTPDEAAEYAPLTPEVLEDRWQHGQRTLADTLDALLVVADTAGHHIPADQPDLVAACIAAVLAAVRNDQSVTIPADQLQRVGGSCPTH